MKKTFSFLVTEFCNTQFQVAHRFPFRRSLPNCITIKFKFIRIYLNKREDYRYVHKLLTKGVVLKGFLLWVVKYMRSRTVEWERFVDYCFLRDINLNMQMSFNETDRAYHLFGLNFVIQRYLFLAMIIQLSNVALLSI